MSADVIDMAAERAKREAQRKRREHFSGMAGAPWWFWLALALAAGTAHYLTREKKNA